MDAASGIAIPAAFGAGLISFLSPCVLPLVPGYISAVAGVAPGQIQARRVIGPSLAFVASFSFIFIEFEQQEWIEKYEVNRIRGGLLRPAFATSFYRKIAQHTTSPLLLGDGSKPN